MRKSITNRLNVSFYKELQKLALDLDKYANGLVDESMLRLLKEYKDINLISTNEVVNSWWNCEDLSSYSKAEIKEADKIIVKIVSSSLEEIANISEVTHFEYPQ